MRRRSPISRGCETASENGKDDDGPEDDEAQMREAGGQENIVPRQNRRRRDGWHNENGFISAASGMPQSTWAAASAHSGSPRSEEPAEGFSVASEGEDGRSTAAPAPPGGRLAAAPWPRESAGRQPRICYPFFVGPFTADSQSLLQDIIRPLPANLARQSGEGTHPGMAPDAGSRLKPGEWTTNRLHELGGANSLIAGRTAPCSRRSEP